MSLRTNNYHAWSLDGGLTPDGATYRAELGMLCRRKHIAYVEGRSGGVPQYPWHYQWCSPAKLRAINSGIEQIYCLMDLMVLNDWQSNWEFWPVFSATADTATGGDVDELTKSTATWTTDQFKGKWLWINVGVAGEQVKEITSNTATTIYVSGTFSPAPGVGTTFRVVKHEYPTYSWTDQTPVTYQQVMTNDWWLYDGSATPQRVKENANTYFLDVGKLNFKETFVDGALNYILTNNTGFDGVLLDYWWPKLSDIQSKFGGTWPYTGYANDDEWWTNAWQPFIDYVYDQFKAAGYRVIANNAGEFGVTGAVGSWGYYKSLQRATAAPGPYMDGTVYEQGGVDWQSNDGDWLAGSTIEDRIAAIAGDPLEVWCANEGLRPSDADYKQKQMVCLALYYLGVPAKSTRHSYGEPYDETAHWGGIDNSSTRPTMWDKNLGEPWEAAKQWRGRYAWTRRFQHGVVMMNYTANRLRMQAARRSRMRVYTWRTNYLVDARQTGVLDMYINPHEAAIAVDV